jgi:hypothetical protein
MRHCVLITFAFSALAGFFAASPSRALEPTDAFPPTTFSVSLLVRPPPGEAFMKTLRLVDPNHDCAVNHTYSFNYTPAYPDCFRSRLIPPPVVWNVAAALAVRVKGGSWSATTCLFGDISQVASDARTVNCNEQLGISGPGLSFGVAGAPLLQTFMVDKGDDTVEFGASLDNIGAATQANGPGFVAALGDAFQAFGGFLQFLGATYLSSVEGPALAAVGTAFAVIGSLIATDADINPDMTTIAAQTCLGGLLGNPPQGSMTPQDAIRTTLTAKQLYEGTQFGPMMVVVPTAMNYQPKSKPFAFEACQASTNVIFIVDRPRNPGTQAWSDGLAFEPRSSDNAVVRRRNAVESFRVDRINRRIVHDSWRYAAFEDSFDPSDGLAVCNGPQSCAPKVWSEPVGGYIASAADPSGQRSPVTATETMPVTALSPDPSQLVLFYVDDGGGFYASTAAFGADDTPNWRTWLVATGLPPNAPVAAIHGYPIDLYTLFWVGADGAVRLAQLRNTPVQPQIPIAVGPISAVIADPGAAIAALQRSPSLPEVFVVGQGAVWLLTSAAGQWSAAPVAPSSGGVASDSPIAAVATTTNNRDIFFLDATGAVQHLDWTSGLNSWAGDPNLPHATAATGLRRLSAVSRAPDNIDVAFACAATEALCGLSIPGNSFPNMLAGPSPAIPASGPSLSGPLSIVAARSTALDIIAGFNLKTVNARPQLAFDTSWQLGAQSWAATAPAPPCDENTCWSFAMSVLPPAVSIAANDSASVHLSTTKLNDSRPINLTYDSPSPGVAQGQFAPTTVNPGEGVDIGLVVALGTPPGPKQPIKITGNNGIETHSVTIDVSTTACVPTSCQALGAQCGSINDMCGLTLPCGTCAAGLSCSSILQCVPSRCTHPRSCPRGFHWDDVDCACVAD